MAARVDVDWSMRRRLRASSPSVGWSLTCFASSLRRGDPLSLRVWCPCGLWGESSAREGPPQSYLARCSCSPCVDPTGSTAATTRLRRSARVRSARSAMRLRSCAILSGAPVSFRSRLLPSLSMASRSKSLARSAEIARWRLRLQACFSAGGAGEHGGTPRGDGNGRTGAGFLRHRRGELHSTHM